MHSAKLFLILGSINAALVVMLGAFGAHGLKARITTEMLTLFQTGVHYHLFHSLGLLVVGVVAVQIVDSVFLKWAGWLMLAGIFLFPGSLYLVSVVGIRWMGMVTPFGGLAFIAAWILFLMAIIKAPG